MSWSKSSAGAADERACVPACAMAKVCRGRNRLRGSGACAGMSDLRRQFHLVQLLSVDAMERDRHRARSRVDAADPEELQAVLGAAVLLHVLRDADELHIGAEGLVDLAGTERAGVDRAADEFPERMEVGEPGFLRTVLRGRRVV